VTDLNIPGSQTTGISPTGGSYIFWAARDDIIRQSMLNLALLEEQELPTAQESVDISFKLNMIVKQLIAGNDKAPGWKMWQRMRADLFLGYSKYLYSLGVTGDHWAAGVTGTPFPTLYNQLQLTAAVAAGGSVLPVASTSSVNINDKIGVLVGNDITWGTVASFVPNTSITLAAALGSGALANAYVWNYTTQAQRPVEIVTAVLRDIYGTDTPLTRMDLQQYEALPTKVQPGFVADPTAFYYEPRSNDNIGHFYIDCSGAQDVTKHLHCVYLRQVQDYNNPGDATDFPQEWFNALSWHLSLNICGMFDGDWTPDRQLSYTTATAMAREGNPQTSSEYFMPESEESY
jgi:hypothetical protein